MSGRRRAGAAVALCAALGLAACAGTPRETLHVLAAVPAVGAAPVAQLAAARIAIDPLSLPESLDRPQWVVRLPGDGLAILEQQRWSEPLRVAIGRALADGLVRALDGATVRAYPDDAPPAARYRIAVEVMRFETRAGNGVTIEAAWTVRRDDGATRTGRSAHTEAVAAGGGYAELASAHGRALEALARDMAGSVATLARG